jgi:hypothetical protein
MEGGGPHVGPSRIGKRIEARASEFLGLLCPQIALGFSHALKSAAPHNANRAAAIPVLPAQRVVALRRTLLNDRASRKERVP